ncbi:M81 family metallopeptidase [Conexibacter stalactiti]|uniref:M81 family metallopeptidase n=1 Tax=Conexibacter stalactiti TaxID=1940611 RepID=A0ABU4I1H2_9ACTN|nr:M81 family metallopeptidase [Conexibacter stalactiti]MDW5598777.1 M81 family metallopeptidase [Conexibacter stalactiti]MEC5039419.1 M81 family metallopeptidase [Conexibacter stalactiti]
MGSVLARVAIVGMWQETNTYSARTTTLADFERFELLEGTALLDRHRGAGSVIGGFLDGLGAAELEPVGVLSAGAWPGGPPDAATTAALLARLDAALATVDGGVDGVLVNLHGAMVADGAADMEAETLARVRERFGAVPLAAVLDLHANLSAEAAALCDAIVGYRTYPHVDMRACGSEAAELVASAVGGADLASAFGKLAALTSPVAQGTDDEPMRGLLARAEARAAAAGVARVSLLPGFPYSDVERAGFGVAATVLAGEVGGDAPGAVRFSTAAAAAAAAREVVAATLADVEAQLADFETSYPAPADAVRAALACRERPLVLADLADNVGGGGPGDGTALLAELIAQEARGAVVTIVDAAAVAAAGDAGPGALVAVELGGHSDALHGAPLPLRLRVARLGDGEYVGGGEYMTGQRFSMGATAVLEHERSGVTVLAMEHATPPFHIEQLTASGIDPSAATVIALKGAVAWRAPYAAVAAGSIAVDTPGCCPADPAALPRARRPAAVEPFVITNHHGAATA